MLVRVCVKRLVRKRGIKQPVMRSCLTYATPLKDAIYWSANNSPVAKAALVIISKLPAYSGK